MITRENYEEFFLLYIDDELSVTMRAEVEKFAAGNTDLGEELDALLQCRLLPDQDHSFQDKSLLFQHEESFLSYIDGELNEQDRKTVEEIVRLHPARAAEMQRLMMTVSQPDLAITFPVKESLYREERSRRVLLMPWMRAGVAAALLVAAATLLLLRSHNDKPVPVAATEKKAPAAVTPSNPVALYTGKEAAKTASGQKPALYATGSKPGAQKGSQAETTDTKAPGTKALSAEKPVPQAIASQTLAPTVKPTTVSPVDTGSKAGEVLVAAVTHPDKTAPEMAVAVNIPKEQSSFATQALMKEAQEDETNDMTADAVVTPGKSKLRGIFRKVTRVFGKTADRDDQGQKQVLISAFQVALK